ncbi:hypothetical protein VCHENC02_3290A, partial [Vibrio harveyi]
MPASLKRYSSIKYFTFIDIQIDFVFLFQATAVD